MFVTPSYLLTEPSGSEKRSVQSTFTSLLSATQYDIRFIDINSLKEVDQNAFIFINAKLFTPRDLLSICMQMTISTSNILVFNLSDSDNGIATQLLQLGTKGVFYVDDSAANIVKGLSAVKQDKLWFPRNVLEISIKELLQKALALNVQQNKQAKIAQDFTPHTDTTLTKRELSIVALVSQGAQNKEIADSLNISINTVKTHIYSIFRKTNCRNRVELMSWSINKIPNLID